MRLALILVLASGLLLSPDPDVHVKFKNGTELRGRLVEMKDGAYVIDLADGRRMSYPASEVEALTRIGDSSAPTSATESAPAGTSAAPTTTDICRVFVTEEDAPAGWATALKKVKWTKGWYGGTSGAYEKLALEAARYGADAVVGVEVGRGPSGFSWSSPKANGIAVKWTEEGRKNAAKLKGECIAVPIK
jgi:hypothetical protein